MTPECICRTPEDLSYRRRIAGARPSVTGLSRGLWSCHQRSVSVVCCSVFSLPWNSGPSPVVSTHRLIMFDDRLWFPHRCAELRLCMSFVTVDRAWPHPCDCHLYLPHVVICLAHTCVSPPCCSSSFSRALSLSQRMRTHPSDSASGCSRSSAGSSTGSPSGSSSGSSASPSSGSLCVVQRASSSKCDSFALQVLRGPSSWCRAYQLPGRASLGWFRRQQHYCERWRYC